jgi:uncharacterized membrane protein
MMRRRWTLMWLGALSLVGLAISLYLSRTYLLGEAPGCLGSGGCATVQASPYSRIIGVPVPSLGALLYFGMVVLTLLSLTMRRRTEILLLALFGTALAGLLFSVYLTAVELLVIHAICLWCAGSAIIILMAFGLSLWALRQFHSERDHQ